MLQLRLVRSAEVSGTQLVHTQLQLVLYCCGVPHVWGSCTLNVMQRRIVVCSYAWAR